MDYMDYMDYNAKIDRPISFKDPPTNKSGIPARSVANQRFQYSDS